MWPEVIEKWKNSVMRDYLSNNFSHNAEQMFRYLECSLGPTAKRIWDAFKATHKDK